MSVSGPLEPGKKPFDISADSEKTAVTGKTRHRKVKEIEAREGYLSKELGELIGQVARNFSPKTADVIRDMEIFGRFPNGQLAERDVELIITLANQIQHLSDLGNSSAELNHWAHKQLRHIESASSLDSGVGRSILSGSDSEEDAASSSFISSSSASTHLKSLPEWGENDERVTKTYELLRDHPIIQEIEAHINDPAVVFHILRSRQATPLIQKMIEDKELSEAEHSALLVQASHLDAMLKKGFSGSFSSAEAFMPTSSEIDLASPQITSEVLMNLASQAIESTAERHQRFKTLHEEGHKAQSYLAQQKLRQDSTIMDLHPRHPLRSKGVDHHSDQLEFIAFRTKAMATPQVAQQFSLADFDSPEQMHRIMDFITQKLAGSEFEQKDVSIALDSMQKQLASWEDSGDNRDLAELCKLIRKLAKATQDPQLSETLALMADHLADKVMTQVRTDFETSLRDQLKALEKPGSSRVITLSVGLGVGLAACGIEGVSLDFGLKYSFAVKAGDDTKIRELRVVNCSATTSVGDEKLATASITLDMKNAKGRVFKNLDDFVSYHANDLVPALIGKLRHSTGNVRGAMRAREQQRRRRKAVANGDLLTQRLQEYGVLLPSQKVQTTIPRKAEFSKFRQIAGGVTGGVSALAGMLDASLTMTNTVTRFKTRYELLKTLREHPGQLLAANPKFITFWTPVSDAELNDQLCQLWDSQQVPKPMMATTDVENIPDAERLPLRDALLSRQEYKKNSAGQIQKRVAGGDAIHWITAMQEECRADKTPKARKQEIREQCKQAILDQYSERDLYFFTLNARDGYIGVDTSRKQQLNKAEKSFRATCGARNPAEFLEAHTCTYYGLWKTYMMTFNDNESPAVDDALFFKPLEHFIEPTLTRPQVNLGSDRHIQKHLRIPAKATSTGRSVEFEVSVNAPKTGITGNIAVVYANAKNNTNPDYDGESLTLSFTVGAGGHLGKAINAAETMLARKKDDNKILSDIPVELLLSPLEEADFDIAAESDVTLELCFQRRDQKIKCANDHERDWHMQYARVTGSKSMGANTPNIGIPTGPVGELKVNFGAKVAETNHWYERPGNNTTSYIQTRYNGWKSGGKIGGTACYWQAWVNQNKKCLNELMVNMGRKTRNANEEMTETFKDIETYLPGFGEKLTFREWLDFRKDFSLRMQLFSACRQLTALAEKAPFSEKDMRKHYGLLTRDFPDLPTIPPEDDFVKLHTRVKKGESTELEQAFGINRDEHALNFENDMLPMFQKFMDLQHQAHSQIARSRYKPSLRRFKAVH